MSQEALSAKTLNRKAAKAGIFFVAVQILVRGLSFLLTPVYTRLVSKAQYGEIRVYESWLLILVPLLSLAMYKSVARAKYDHPDDYEEYVASVQGLSHLSVAAVFLVITLFFRKQFMDFMGLDWIMYIFMILYCFAYSSTNYYQARERQLLRYKQSVILTALMMFPASLLSVILLWLGNRWQKPEWLVDLRIIGFYLPQVAGGLCVALLMFKQGGFRIRKKYWKYALGFSLPLIPETLSIQIMNQSDKIMVRKMVGGDPTGVFSLATTVSFIIWVIEDAVWAAWLPWLFEKLDRKEAADIERPWTYISYGFAYFSWALVILSPEIVKVLGGSRYEEAIYLVAPMVTGTLFRFFSFSFTAMQNYRKKTFYCGMGTVAAMLVNIVLNAVCIHFFGYQAAAYTTAFSYFVLLLVQGILEKKVCGMRCVTLWRVLLRSLVFWAVNELTVLTYTGPTLLRWGIMLLVSILAFWKLWPGLNTIRKQLKK